MIEVCRSGETCIGCPAMGLGIDLGTEVAQTAQAVHDALRGNIGVIADATASSLHKRVIGHNKFSKEVLDDGAPFYTAVGVLKRIAYGKCTSYNDQLNNKGENNGEDF
jgi:hypothetical protein